MAYNKSPSCVERWTKVLDQMAENTVLRIDTAHPDKLAYRIREALYAARYNDIEPYDSLEYTVRIEGSQVVCEPKQDLVSSVHTGSQYQRFESVTNEFEVVDRMNKLMPPAAIFPDFNGDISSVESWAEAKDYTITNQEPLTLRREESA